MEFDVWRRLACGAILTAGCLLPIVMAQAEEVFRPGATVSRQTLETIADSKFGEHRLSDLIPAPIAWQIQTYGLKLHLKETEPHPVDPRWLEATRKYGTSVRLDPETHTISGWRTGVPFPDIDPADPQAGTKVIWNLVRGRPRGDDIDHREQVIILISGKTGLERVQYWTYRILLMKGRLGNPGPVLGDGTIYRKELLSAYLPQDIKGIGTFTIYYDNGKFNDSWAYVRDVRRVRRLSGSAWMDPVGSMDTLNDDFATFNAYPGWYKEYQYLGKSTVLVVANSRLPWWVHQGTTPDEQMPRIDLANPPYWNIVDDWEPREIHMVKAIPHDDHPYGHKIIYIDAQNWTGYLSDVYDKAGERWKTQIMGWRAFPTEDDPRGAAIYEVYQMMVDFRKEHASAYDAINTPQFNTGMREQDVDLTVLEAAGR